MNSDSTGSKLLTPEPSAQLRDSSWSPDGTEIAFFAQRREDSDILSKYHTPLHYPLYEINAAGGKPRRLLNFPVSDFVWAPDSRQLLYVSAYEDPNHDDPLVLRGKTPPMSAIYVLNMQTGGQRRLTSFGQNCSGAWSPDGRYIALSFGTEQSSDIYAVSLDGTHQRRITDSDSIDIRPAWSPDGKSIAYVSVDRPGAEDQTAGVYIINADGTGKRRVSNLIASQVAWSPDGRRLLVQWAGGASLMDTDGKNVIYLTPGNGRSMDAVFTPDGRNVMFRSDYEGDWYLYAVDLSGGHLRKITDLTASMFCLSPLLSKN